VYTFNIAVIYKAEESTMKGHDCCRSTHLHTTQSMCACVCVYVCLSVSVCVCACACVCYKPSYISRCSHLHPHVGVHTHKNTHTRTHSHHPHTPTPTITQLPHPHPLSKSPIEGSPKSSGRGFQHPSPSDLLLDVSCAPKQAPHKPDTAYKITTLPLAYLYQLVSAFEVAHHRCLALGW
jgi:hypothetical protein